MIRVIPFLALLASVVFAKDTKEFDTEYRLKWEGRYGLHLHAPHDVATVRQYLSAEQKAWWRELSANFGVRTYAEGAFAANPSRFGKAVRENESIDVAVRDAFVQFKNPHWQLRLGHQQVVWGEAFGFYFADAVNPKDMREFGLNDLSDQRITVPMVNAVIFLGEAAWQLIYIPKPFFNQVGSLGGDFAFPFERFFPGADIRVSARRTLPWGTEYGEVGTRLSLPVAGFDLAVFAFHYFDRNPNYEFSILSPAPLSVEFRETHERIQSLGLTFSKEWNAIVFRGEGIFHVGKRFDKATPGTFSFFKANEIVGVLGADYSTEPFRLGAQISVNKVLADFETLVFPPIRKELLSLHGSFKTIAEQNVELMTSYAPFDGSSLLELKYLIPISRQTELLFGADALFGGEASQFGQFRRATRAFVKLRSIFTG